VRLAALAALALSTALVSAPSRAGRGPSPAEVAPTAPSPAAAEPQSPEERPGHAVVILTTDEVPTEVPAEVPAEPPAEVTAAERAERLDSLRNLGKALYENPATQYEAVDVLREALALAPGSARERINLGLAMLRAGRTDEGIAALEAAQGADPSIPHTWFNLGIEAKRASQPDRAITQLERMAELVPDEPITRYNLGVLYKLGGDLDRAIAAFERAAELDPHLAGPWYQLAAAYRQSGRPDDAARAMERFRELKALQRGDAVAEDLEWSYYAELYDPAVPAEIPLPSLEPEFAAEATEVELGADPGLAVLDVEGDGRPDLLAWSADGLALLAGGTRPTDAGLGGITGVRAVAPGDFDDDGLPDLAVVTGGGLILLRNAGGGFERHATALPELPWKAFSIALWLDYDHDYDVDLFLLGERSALVRNLGGGAFGDATETFPFAAGTATAAARLDLVADAQGFDLAVAYAGRPGTLYRDLLGGRYQAAPLPALPAGTRALAAHDLDADRFTDLAAAGPEGVVLLRNDQEGGFERIGEPAGPAGARALASLDVENRGAADLVAGGAVLRTQGGARLREAASLAGPDGPAALPALAAADFDGDGLADVAAVDGSGRVALFVNRLEPAAGHLVVRLQGVKNPKLAPGAEVEVKAGASYQKRTYEGVPLTFGLGPHRTVDTVRITWPNGLIQNETRQPAGTVATYEEAARLSGSCPMIFVWNGAEWEFVSDVLGVAPLGAAAGDGVYFDVDHDETVQIAGSRLAPRDGRYEVRMTEELREVTYLDQVRLLAVDHPAELELFTDEKFVGPPYPELRLYGVGTRLRPVAARDHRGRDVLDRVVARDGAWPTGFARDHSGRAELHWLELDFGPAAAAGDDLLLVLSGWVDWADGSTFLAAAQGGEAELVMPQLQVRDAEGRWVTVIEDMGLPAGKPKSIVVDLRGRFLSASRAVRIVTSLVVYWDEAFLTPDVGEPPHRSTSLLPATAELGFRGFSRVVVHPERLEPERFVYADVRPSAPWSQTQGLYTRYGDVAELAREIDDRFVVFGSGDELRLAFDAAALPPLPSGWTRDFLLFVDGWAKDGDANTAHSQTVGPLPYHAMPSYPYAPPHAYPDDPEHRAYLETWQTRPALRLIRPLVETTARGGYREGDGGAAAKSAPDRPPSPTATRAPSSSVPTPPAIPFTDVTAEAGVSFVHTNGATPDKLLPETMGGGVGFVDYDGDGDADLLFVNSAPSRTGDLPPTAALPPPAVLYRNDGGWRFTDVTEATGLAEAVGPGFDGMGVAAGDFDGDGRTDLFLTAVGRDRLLANRGERFVDVTEAAGVGGPADAWSTGAAFFDADGDGDLDLWVVRYVVWSPAVDAELDFRLDGIGRAFGRPQRYAGTDSALFLNRGDGTFAEAAAAAGVQVAGPEGAAVGKGLAVHPVDLDGDGRLDVAVANDTVRNFLFHNRGGGRFEEVGELWGVAYDPDGRATGAMGTDSGALGDDGRLALVVGNYADEATSIYLADPEDPTFLADETLATGVAGPTRPALTFGLLLLDADLDGRLDLLQVNGHVEPDVARVTPTQSYRQPAQLLWNAGPASPGGPPRFVEVPATAAGDLGRPLAGRGAAWADVDLDGDLDLAIAQVGGPAVLLRNDQATGHGWLRVELTGQPPNREAIGAEVELTAGGRSQRRAVMPTRSYLSQVELPLTFGLGAAKTIDALRVRWPDGTVQEVPADALRPGRTVRVEKPAGTSAGSGPRGEHPEYRPGS